MGVEPLYGLPVEGPGDVEGWSVNSGQTGDLLADAIAAELDRIEGGIAAFQATIAKLPRTIQAGNVRLPREVFRPVDDPFYSFSFLRGAEAITFEQQFDEVPAVVLLPNNADAPGTLPIEATVTDVTVSGFTAVVAAAFFTGTFVSRWIAIEHTQ